MTDDGSAGRQRVKMVAKGCRRTGEDGLFPIQGCEALRIDSVN